MAKIENEVISLEVSSRGAEIISLFNKETNLEYIWSGDATYWAGRTPILFPIVGSTWDKKIHIDNQVYEMGNHGLVRTAEFKEEKCTKETLVFSYESNAETEAKYPFQFKLWVEYRLRENKVLINYRVENKSQRSMPFSFGLHPAFRCPLVEGESFDDYHIEFSHNETLSGLYGSFGLQKENKIPLSYPLFENNGTLCFEYPKSSSVKLTQGKHGVSVDLVGYRWLAFWTPKPQAPFLCIEPWHGHGDFEKVEASFENREGTLILEKGKTYLTTLGIEIF